LLLEGFEVGAETSAGGSGADLDSEESSSAFKRDCRESARLLQTFVEERLIVLADAHEDALFSLERGVADLDEADLPGSIPEALRADSGTRAGLAKIRKRNERKKKKTLRADFWGAAARYALLAERGSEAGLGNLAWLMKTRGVSFRMRFETGDFPKHITRMTARDAARDALTRLVDAGDVGSRVDLGDVEWASATEGDASLAISPASSESKRVSGNSEGSEGGRVPVPPAGSPPSLDSGGTGPSPRFIPDPPPRLISGDGGDTGVAGSATDDWSRPSRPPAPATPPRSFQGNRLRRVRFHYEEASLLGVPEGSVSFAWALSRGVGIARDLKRAEETLWRAHRDSEDALESFIPTAAAVSVRLCRIFLKCASWIAPNAAQSRLDPIRAFDSLFGGDEANAILYPGAARASPGTDRRRRVSGLKTSAFFLKVETCALAVLVCGFAAIGYARFVALSGEHTERRAAVLDRISPLTVDGVAGAVAAAAWMIL
jgi:hypothetical protein